MDDWIVISITTKCPIYGKEYTDEGDDAMGNFEGSMICDCGFEGELPQ